MHATIPASHPTAMPETTNIPRHRTPPSIGDRNGFSLIELLAAVAIVVLVIGWLLPALHAARLSARSMTCGSNVRQMAVAALGYTADHDGWIFPMRETLPSAGTRWWFGLEPAGGPTQEGHRHLDRTRGPLWPYYGSPDSIEVCPSFAVDSDRYKPKFTTNWTTYGHPLKLMNPAEPVRLQRIVQPSEMLAFADAAQINRFQSPATPARPLFEQWHYLSRAEATMHYVHDATANASMYDGHVRTLEPMYGLVEIFPEAPVGRPPSTVRLQVD